MKAMAVTASELRANIYKILDSALETGLPVEVERKGKILRIIPVGEPSKLSRLPRRADFIRGDAADLVHMDWSSEWKP
jgi:antitoxin (DNA-binding transcriptional repressor) of toxin-antitoxin stability system